METGPTDPKKSRPSESNSYLKYSGLGIQLVGTIGLFAWAGYLLDQYLSIQFPVFLLSFVLLAFLGNMVVLYRSVRKS
jgi:F0F1-type ATP synthase assembly protein I